MSKALSPTRDHLPKEWERIKRRFCQLYYEQNKTLKEVVLILKYEENFDATEKQYKKKIKLWGLRKNATPEDYALAEYALARQLINSPSSDALSEVLMSHGIRISDKKIRRHMRNKGKTAPATIKGEMSPSPSCTGGPSAMPPQAADDGVHSWISSTGDETSPELDRGRSSSRFMELCRELKEKEAQMNQLEQQKQATERHVADLRRLVHSETAVPNLSRKDAEGTQNSAIWRINTIPPQSTGQQLWPYPPTMLPGASHQASVTNSRTGFQPVTTAKATSPVPTPENLTITEDGAKNQWSTRANCDPQPQTYQQGHHTFGNPMPPPALVGNEPYNLSWGNPSVDYQMPMPLQTGLTPVFGSLPLPSERASQEATMNPGAATSMYQPAYLQSYFDERN